MSTAISKPTVESIAQLRDVPYLTDSIEADDVKDIFANIDAKAIGSPAACCVMGCCP